MRMTVIAAVAACGMALSACTTGQGAVVGGATVAVGGLATGTFGGALVGGAVGALAGAILVEIVERLVQVQVQGPDLPRALLIAQLPTPRAVEARGALAAWPG